jgi:hypothetical protein
MLKIILGRGLAAGVLGVSLLSFNGAAQIPNGGFEAWSDCMPTDWASPNVCGILEPITKSSSSESGSFAARGEVLSLFGQKIGPALQSGTEGEGIPISERYVSLDGSYKFQPIGGDRFGVNVVFSHGGTVIAQGAIALTAAAASYTAFQVPMVYTSSDVPDSAVIQILIAGPVTGSDYHVGSVMFVDSLAFKSGGTVTPPSLTIARSGNSVTVSWPADAVGFKLQSTGTLTPPAWADVDGIGQAHTYQFTATGTETFFRLTEQ